MVNNLLLLEFIFNWFRVLIIANLDFGNVILKLGFMFQANREWSLKYILMQFGWL